MRRYRERLETIEVVAIGAFLSVDGPSYVSPTFSNGTEADAKLAELKARIDGVVQQGDELRKARM